jgi:hypothetical protein
VIGSHLSIRLTWRWCIYFWCVAGSARVAHVSSVLRTSSRGKSYQRHLWSQSIRCTVDCPTPLRMPLHLVLSQAIQRLWFPIVHNVGPGAVYPSSIFVVGLLLFWSAAWRVGDSSSGRSRRLFSITPGPALGPNQTPIQRIRGLPPGGKAARALK